MSKVILDPSILFAEGALDQIADPELRPYLVVSAALVRHLESSDAARRLAAYGIDASQAQVLRVRNALDGIEQFSSASGEFPAAVQGIRDRLLRQDVPLSDVLADEWVFISTQSIGAFFGKAADRATAAFQAAKGVVHRVSDKKMETGLKNKPLPLFYAGENLLKALVIVQDAQLEASDFRAHGLSGDKSKRYSIKNLVCTVRSPGSDVWSRVYATANGDRVKLDVTRNGNPVITEWWDAHQTPAPAPDSELQLGDLLRRLPELTDDLIFAEWPQSYMVHIRDYRFTHNDGPPVTETANVTYRHGHHAATKAMVLAAEHRRGSLLGWTRATDTLDILRYSTHSSGASIFFPEFRLDAFGELYGEFMTTRQYGEMVVYQAALFILADVVRYQVDLWKRLLDDHPSEMILVEHFLELAIRKLPNLVLNELSGQLHAFQFAR